MPLTMVNTTGQSDRDTTVDDWFDGTFIVLDDGGERRFNVKGACMLNKITEGYIDDIFLYDGTGTDDVDEGGLAVFVSKENDIFVSKAINDGKFTGVVTAPAN